MRAQETHCCRWLAARLRFGLDDVRPQSFTPNRLDHVPGGVQPLRTDGDAMSAASYSSRMPWLYFRRNPSPCGSSRQRSPHLRW